jgi:hypothetical protein
MLQDAANYMNLQRTPFGTIQSSLPSADLGAINLRGLFQASRLGTFGRLASEPSPHEKHANLAAIFSE